MAGMVSVSRNLVWRAVPLVRNGLRNRVLRRLWMGLGALGVQLAWRIPNVWRGQILFPEHHILQSERFLPRRWRTRRSWRAHQREHRRARRSFQPSRLNDQTFQRKHPGCPRIRCTPRSERRPLGRLQRLQQWRTGKELFVTRKRQRGWRSSPWRRWRSSPWRRWRSSARRRWRSSARRRWRASVIEVSLCSQQIVTFRNGKELYAAN